MKFLIFILEIDCCFHLCLQTLALQDCMIQHKDYYKDFIGLADNAEGERLRKLLLLHNHLSLDQSLMLTK